MKKTPKKLSLTRETLRALEEESLPQALGGASTLSCAFSNCRYTCYLPCQSE